MGLHLCFARSKWRACLRPLEPDPFKPPLTRRINLVCLKPQALADPLPGCHDLPEVGGWRDSTPTRSSNHFGSMPENFLMPKLW